MTKKSLRPKRSGSAINVRTFTGQKDGRTYLVFRTDRGSFHVFTETEAKEAAVQCGAKRKGNTRSMWASIWGQ
jgi:hypothetical protein